MKLGFYAAITLMAASAPLHAQKDKGGEKQVLFQDFEKLKNKDGIAELGAVTMVEGLSSPTSIPADIFQVGGSGDVGIPINIYGKEEPSADGGGKIYAGIIAYKPGKAAAERSYLTMPIAKGKEQITLKKGLTYCIEFSVSLSESSKFASNNIGILFSKETPGTGGAGAIFNSSDHVVKGQLNKVYTGFFGWEKVCNIYTAKGDEKFITVGNFDHNDRTKFEQLKKPKDSETEQVQHAYYYIDNISIRQIDNATECKCYNNKPPKVSDSFSTLLYTCNPEFTDKMTKDQFIEQHTVFFRAGKASLSENGKEMMNYVISEMKNNPSMKIEIIGHNDALEDKAGEEDPDFEDMARKRVAAVVKYFVGQGIEEERLIKTYKGATVQNAEIAEDDDQETKDAKNRRVNFKIVK